MSWRPLTRDRQDATQQELCRILGVTEETFAHSVFAAQGATHFADAGLTAAERKAILAEAVGLGDYDRLLDLCRADLRSANALSYGLDSRLRLLAEQLDALDGAEERFEQAQAETLAAKLLVTECEELQARLRREYDDAREARAALEAEQRLLAERERTLAALNEKRRAATVAAEEAGTLRPLQDDLAGRALDLQPLRDRMEALRDQQRQHDDAVARVERLNEQARNHLAAAQRLRGEEMTLLLQAGELRNRADEIEAAEAPVCDRCEQPLHGDARTTAARSLRAEADAIEAEAREKGTDGDHHARESAALDAAAAGITVCEKPRPEQVQAALQAIASAQDAQVKLAQVTARLSVLEAAVAEAESDAFVDAHFDAVGAVTASRSRIALLQEGLPSEAQVQQLAKEALGADVSLRDARADEERLVAGLAKAAADVDTRQRLQAQQDAASEEITDIRRRVTVLEALERMYSRDGVPALILESAVIPTLEQHANEFLDAWGLRYRVELRTQRELKTSARLKDTLDVVVVDGVVERNYQTYSGGERARVNVALRVALARLLAHRRGAAMQVFALDEVEYLDAAGQERLAELLRELTREIPIVLLVTHSDTLRDRVDQTLTVVREGGVSRLEVGA